MRDLGGEAIPLPADVADPEQVESAAVRFEDEFGPLDGWINCAMATVIAPLHEVTPEEFRRVTEVTYLGQVFGTMAALKRMRPRNRGVIVQVGSALAYRSIPLQAPYCGAKHAIVGFTDSLRSELLHDKSNIRVSVVQLPAVNTPQFDWARNKMPKRVQPVPPIFQPEVVAEAVRFVLHHPRRELWVTRSAVLTIIGQRLMPGRMDRILANAGYEGQLTPEAAPANRPDNLFGPVAGEWSAHGRFDDRASTFAPWLFVTRHRAALALIFLVLAVVVIVLVLALT